jgi:hypothetical protein
MITSFHNALAQEAFRILVIGDSIAWGQGLLQEQKYPWIIANEIRSINSNIEVSVTSLAHSGAAIDPNWEYKFNWNLVPGQDDAKLKRIILQTPLVSAINDFVHQFLIDLVIENERVRKVNDNTIQIGPRCISVAPATSHCASVEVIMDNTRTRAGLRVSVSANTAGVIRPLDHRDLDRAFFTIRNEGGQTIAYHFSNALHGEIPIGGPTEHEQIDLYTGSTDDVNLILVSGCIVDVDAVKITDFRTAMSEIEGLVNKFCKKQCKIF